MAYRLKLGEPVAKGFRRVALDQVDAAIVRVEGRMDAADVHEARKHMKRVRALLRLVRFGIGETAFKRENTRFGDIARMLSGARDLHVMQATLARLETRYGLLGRNTLTTGLRRELAGLVEASERKRNRKPGDEVLSALTRARQSLAKLKLDADECNGVDIIAAGIKFSYGAGRAALAEAYRTGDDEAFHDLRKGVQQHWRHMLLLSRVWPDAMAARANASRELSRLLGDEHDLTVLAAMAERLGGSGVRQGETAAIVALCRAHQGELRALAEPRARRLFAERPKALARRIRSYWRSAKAMKPLPAHEEEDDHAAAGDGAAKPVHH